ncbi:hypothetical protein TI04_01625 [Achromatium sp. WMS2]|nr:hypothetical protein TI04_01625 [Achromatium sp. WMS2]
MNKKFAVLLAMLLYVMPFSSQAAAPSGAVTDENYHYYLAAGAVGGALLFNLVTGGIEAIPFVTSSSSMWEGPMAANRVLTAMTVALGILAVDWGYKNLDLKKTVDQAVTKVQDQAAKVPAPAAAH